MALMMMVGRGDSEDFLRLAPESGGKTGFLLSLIMFRILTATIFSP